MQAVLVLCVALSLAARMGAENACGDPEAPSASHSIPAPQMSAEERLSPHMPEALRCDACHAIAFQVRGNIHQQPCTVPNASGCWRADKGGTGLGAGSRCMERGCDTCRGVIAHGEGSWCTERGGVAFRGVRAHGEGRHGHIMVTFSSIPAPAGGVAQPCGGEAGQEGAERVGLRGGAGAELLAGLGAVSGATLPQSAVGGWAVGADPNLTSPCSYGVQELRGERRLMGPGLPGQEAMSVAVMGGPWPGR